MGDFQRGRDLEQKEDDMRLLQVGDKVFDTISNEVVEIEEIDKQGIARVSNGKRTWHRNMPGLEPAANHPPFKEDPSHYTSHPSGVECITITEHMTFCAGNAIKYLWRAGLKSITTEGQVEDLKKARWYIDREIARLGGT